MRNQVISIMALGIALAIAPAASFARGGGGGGGGGSSAHVSSTGGAALKGPAGSAGTKAPRYKSAAQKRKCWNGQGHIGGRGPSPQRCGSSGGITASAPPTCKAGGEGCQRQH
jgi:hypothetical protein